MDPWVSTFISMPRLAAACASFSAAMYVCAMPVGHAVTASSLIRCRWSSPLPVGGGPVGLVTSIS